VSVTIILAAIASGLSQGRAIRRKLQEQGLGISGPAFYHEMSKLEARGLIEGWDQNEEVAGHIIPLRHYRIAKGEKDGNCSAKGISARVH
jgi:hypothetical protein